jgi:hypothetical protein
MRTLLSAFALALFLSLGTNPSFAKTPCDVELAKAKAVFAKVRQKGMNSQKKALVKNIDATVRKAEKATEAGDNKACHTHTKKIITMSKKIN